MKPALVLTLCLLFNTLLNAQFDPEKYFTDSVSFVYNSCQTTRVKQKEIRSCADHTFSAAASFTDFSVYESVDVVKPGQTNEHLTGYIMGKIADIDFSNSEIKEYNAFGSETSPAVFYELLLRVKNERPWFSVKPLYFKERLDPSVSLYFATYEDADAAKKFLQARS